MRYFHQQKVIYWKWDGKRMRVFEEGRWIKSVFLDPKDLTSTLDGVVETTRDQLPKSITP